MNYSLCKLRFTAPLHAGSGESAKSLDGSEFTLCADTVFSALCHTAEADSGVAAVSELCDLASSGGLLLSDAMPYCGEELYVPRPLLPPTGYRDTPASERKLMKALKYLSLNELPDYVSFVCGDGDFSPSGAVRSFGTESAAEKVALKGFDVSSPYSVGLFSFDADCGLYLLLAAEREETLDHVHRLLVLLGCGGVGGKVSSGYGKFELAEDPYVFDDVTEEYDQIRLLQRLLCEDFPCYMSVTSSLPNDGELDEALMGSFYMVRRRGGFVQSHSFGRAAKKRTQFFLAAGSVFRSRYGGGLYSVASGEHEVFRYSRPLFLGVDYR